MCNVRFSKVYTTDRIEVHVCHVGYVLYLLPEDTLEMVRSMGVVKPILKALPEQQEDVLAFGLFD